MGSLFRSEEMELYQLILHTHTSYACVSKLGEIGVVEFRDLNVDLIPFQRKFTDEIRCYDEMERKLRYFRMEIQKDGIRLPANGANGEEDAAKIESQKHQLNELQTQIDNLEVELRTVNENAKELKRNYLILTELKHILRKIHELNDTYDDDDDDDEEDDGGNPSGTDENASIAPVFGLWAGAISNDRLPSFERMLCRTLHGHNLYYHQTMIIHPMEDSETGEIVSKSVFIAFFHGDEIRMRIDKICTGFHMILHPFPIAQVDRRRMAIKLMKRIVDLNVVLQQTQEHRHRLLMSAAKSLNDWSIKVCKIKAIYHALNKFNANTMRNVMIAECWIPTRHIDEVQSALKDAAARAATAATAKQSQAIMMPLLNRIQAFDEPPPTYFITNQFTSAFQMLTESYGVANYREMNPAPYTIVTIPFLFAVMFGDMGHGILLVLFALWMMILWGKSAGIQQNAADNEVSCGNSTFCFREKKPVIFFVFPHRFGAYVLPAATSSYSWVFSQCTPASFTMISFRSH